MQRILLWSRFPRRWRFDRGRSRFLFLGLCITFLFITLVVFLRLFLLSLLVFLHHTSYIVLAWLDRVQLWFRYQCAEASIQQMARTAVEERVDVDAAIIS